MKKRLCWMAVTADEYELPLAVADTAAELARSSYGGVDPTTVIGRARAQASGRYSGRRFIRVEMDEEEEQEEGTCSTA